MCTLMYAASGANLFRTGNCGTYVCSGQDKCSDNTCQVRVECQYDYACVNHNSCLNSNLCPINYRDYTGGGGC